MSNTSSITYRQVGDYLIPNLILSPEQANIKLSKWGIMRKKHLLKHQKVAFNIMLTEGSLWPHLADIDRQATEMYELLIEQMKKAEGVTEKLKKENQMEWVYRMSNIDSRVKEIVFNELIYV